MHECVMMSEHLVHYQRSLAAKFNAAKFQDKENPKAGINAISEDKEALHTWNTLQELLSASVSQATMTTKVHVYLIPNVESG